MRKAIVPWPGFCQFDEYLPYDLLSLPADGFSLLEIEIQGFGGCCRMQLLRNAVVKTLAAFKIGPQQSHNNQGTVSLICCDILGSVAHGSAAAKTQPAMLPQLNSFNNMVLEGV